MAAESGKGEASKRLTYEEELLETGGLSAFLIIPRSFRKYGKWMDLSEYQHYCKKVTESDGFDVSGCTGRIGDGIGEYHDTTKVIPAAEFAVNEHNKNTGATLKFMAVVRANIQCLGVVVYYITLKAVEEQNNYPPKLYRAKVLKHRISILKGQTEADRKYTLESFYESPQQTLEQPPAVSAKKKSKKHKRPSSPQYETRSRRPFYKFVREMRTFVEHHYTPFYDVVRLAKKEWESLPPEDKALYAE